MKQNNELSIAFDNFNKNMSKEELDYLEMYSIVKELVSKPDKTSEDISLLVQGLNYLTTMKPVYEESKKIFLWFKIKLMTLYF